MAADRKSGAPLRCHSVGSVDQLHVPYIYPSAQAVACGHECSCAQRGLPFHDITKACSSLLAWYWTILREHCPDVRAAGESGGRTDVRWLALSETDSGAGLLATAVGPGSSMQVGQKREGSVACACVFCKMQPIRGTPGRGSKALIQGLPHSQRFAADQCGPIQRGFL